MYHGVQLTRVRALELHGICIPGGVFEVRCDQGTRGIVEYNHANELLKQHNDSIKSQQWQNIVYELQCSSAAKSAQERREKQEIASAICLLFSKTQYCTGALLGAYRL